VTERAIVFGAHGGLIGVLSEPATALPGKRRAVIMSNIGMHHRAGPFRLYVKMARRLADAGVAVLRFDMSGMGDSVPRGDAASPADRAARDLDDAMRWLTESAGIEEFILVGLCSGVDSTHAAATRDPRVKGAVFIDGYVYPTTGFHVRKYTVRFLQLGRWRRYLRRWTRGGRRGGKQLVEATVFERDLPTHDQFRRDVAAMTQRGADLLFVFTAGVMHEFNSLRQLSEMLGTAPDWRHIASELMPRANHVFSSAEQRDMLLSRLERWVLSLPR
jgi:pimeloyl-ACP methyl ester carboxylesterase